MTFQFFTIHREKTEYFGTSYNNNPNYKGQYTKAKKKRTSKNTNRTKNKLFQKSMITMMLSKFCKTNLTFMPIKEVQTALLLFVTFKACICLLIINYDYFKKLIIIIPT